MKVYIQEIETGLFYGMDNSWTPNIESARVFVSVEQAQRFCRILRLTGVQVIAVDDSGRALAYPSLVDS